MLKPSTKPIGELILPVFTQWEKVGSLTGILGDLESGILYDASLLIDQMMRDDRIRATWNVRIQSVLGMPMRFENAEHSAEKRSQKIAAEAEDNWAKMVPRAELVELMKWGLFLGVGIARKNWTRINGALIPIIQTWHPGALRFDLTTDRYMLQTRTGGEIPILPDDPNWVIFTPYGHKYGRLNGIVRSIAMLYLARQWSFRDRARHSEVHGQPIRVGVTPEDANQGDKDRMRRALSSVGSETVIITPQGEHSKYDVKLIEAMSNGHQTFSAQIDHIDDCIAILLLGQRMSTKGSSGLGSDANPGDVVRRDIMRFDAECIADIGKDSVLRDWAMMRYGDASLAPKPIVEVDPAVDGQKKAMELSALGDVVAKLGAHGLDVRSLLEQAGAPMLSPEEAAAAKQESIDQAQQAQAQAQAALPSGAPDNKSLPPKQDTAEAA